MKLFFDENISYKLVATIRDIFPGYNSMLACYGGTSRSLAEKIIAKREKDLACVKIAAARHRSR